MLRYYWELLREVPETLVDAGSRWMTIIGLIVTVLAVAGAVRDERISPWLILVPVALLVVWGMLRANWGRYDEARKLANRAEQSEQLAELQREELVNAKRELAVSQAQYGVFKQWHQEQGDG